MKFGYIVVRIFIFVIFIGLLICRKCVLENVVYVVVDNSSEVV